MLKEICRIWISALSAGSPKNYGFLPTAAQPTTFAARLSTPADAQYRWRIGNYRILFDLDNHSQLIIILKNPAQTTSLLAKIEATQPLIRKTTRLEYATHIPAQVGDL